MVTTFELRWGVKQSFRQYINAAEGITRVSDGAALDGDGRIVFPHSDADWNDSDLRVLRFGGGVEFEAHGGLLSLSLRQPWLEFGDGETVLSVAHPAFSGTTDRRLSLCSLGPVVPTVEEGVLVIREAATSLLMEATGTFDYLYPPGTSLDPVSMSVREASSSPRVTAHIPRS